MEKFYVVSVIKEKTETVIGIFEDREKAETISKAISYSYKDRIFCVKKYPKDMLVSCSKILSSFYKGEIIF